MKRTTPDLLDALDSPAVEVNILIHLTRYGPADAAALAEAIGSDVAEVREALAAMVRTGRIRLSADGQAHMTFGWSRHRTLPTEVWRSLLLADRLYSEQEIATLRTAIPMLQFARAKLGEFSDHGPAHALRVKSFATQLGSVLGLTKTEQHLLRAAALFHDVGNAVDRHRHHLISQETVERLAAVGDLPFSSEEAALVGLLCRWHRTREQDFNPERIDTLCNELVRTGLLASILRVADAMDIDHRRSDYTEPFARVLKFFFSEELPYWTSLEEIVGVRIRCTPAVRQRAADTAEATETQRAMKGKQVALHVFVRCHTEENMQIDMLRTDLRSTPLDWSIEVIAVDDSVPEVGKSFARKEPQASSDATGRAALIACPFDPHSLVMAALSRKHLRAAGYAVELLCYPDTADGPAWLWSQALPPLDPTNWAQLVVIGDRPNPRVMRNALWIVKQWQATDARISLLNRHEANWSHVPRMLGLGVEVTLGGDWAYFWGEVVSGADLAWGRIASLCTRDPTQSTVGITTEEQTVMQGLLTVIYDAAAHPPDDAGGWAALAEPIIERIAADDRAWFVEQASGFGARYAPAVAPSRVAERVLLFEQPFGLFPQAALWAMEAAIERYGRAPVRGIHFNVPYAIAIWSAAPEIELLAISHWREEAAVPIRLLYPAELGPSPEGNESAIRVRLPADRAAAVVEALLAACNKG